MKTLALSAIGTLRGTIARFSGTVRIIRSEFLPELCRLNRLGIERVNGDESRRASPRQIKALITERYQEPRACC
jgi:hypothetical protein